MTATPSFEEIAETFELLDDWEERYRYLIELGRDIPGLPDGDKTDASKVDGCVSQVWITTAQQDGPSGPLFSFEADSDAHIVRGLIAVLRALLSGTPADKVAASDPIESFAQLGLDSHLSPQRSNGLRAMVVRLKTDAAAMAG